jgi:hypothetical protein
MGVSVREYAEHRKCSPQAIRKHIKSGKCPVLKDGTIDPDAADAALSVNLTPFNPGKILDAIGKPVVSTSDEAAKGSLLEARTRVEQVKAKTAELEYRRKRGKLVDVKEVEKAAFARARTEREALLNWPVRVSAEIAANLGVAEKDVCSELESRIRQFLEERSRDSSDEIAA